MTVTAGPGVGVQAVEPARDRAPSRAAPGPWPLAAVSMAALSAFLAWGAVAPAGSGDAARVGLIPLSWPAIASGLVALATGWWLRRRQAAAPLWLLAATLLPWLPVVPSGPLLLWHGPAALVVVSAVAILAAWPLLARLAGWVLSRGARDQAGVAFLVAVVAYGAAAWRMQPQLPGGDEPHYLVITQSLLSDGDLRIENNHRRGDYRDYTAQELKPDFLKRGLDGQIYSIHAPGTSVLVLPAFAVAGYPGVVAWLVLLSAVGATLAWWAAWRLTADAGSAWVGWAAVALSAPYVFEAFEVFPDGPAAVLTMLCAAALVTPDRLQRTGAALACGIAAAALPWLHTRYALVAGVLGVLLALRIAERREGRGARLAAFFAVPAVSAAAWLGLFHAIYGTFSPAAPYGGYTQSSIVNAPRGLTGLLLDQQFGVLPNAPVYVVALLGASALWSLRRRLALELAAIVAPYAVAVACYHMWWGGRSAPARFLVPVLLPLALAVAAFWHRAGRTGRAFAGAAVMVSAAIAFALAWVDRGALVFNVRDGYALWLDALSPLVRLPLALPSLFRGSPAQAWAVALGWAAVASIAVAGVRWSERLASRGRAGIAPPAYRALVAAGVLATATVGSAVGWRLAGADPVDPGNGLLRVVRGAERGEVLGWRSAGPVALVPRATLASSIEVPSVERRVGHAATAWAGVDLPAGRYEVRSTSGLHLSGRLAVRFGSEGVPLAEATLRNEAPGVLPLGFDLPGGAASLRVTGDPQAVRTAGAVHLRLASPRRLPADRARTYARALSQGPPATWFLDGNAFVEPGGFWVRGSAETVLVVDGRGRSPEMVLRAGPVAVTVTVTVGRGEPLAVTLQPGTSEAVGVAAASPTVVRVRASTGFRPREHDPSNPDRRRLGVRVELR